eukprot:2331482-Pyramimonas_sp.AAC.1
MADVETRVLHGRKRPKTIVHNCLILVMDQVADQGHGRREWPRDLSPCQWPDLKHTFRETEIQSVIFDGCMFGVKATDAGPPMMGPWEIWSSSPRARQRLAVRCAGRHTRTHTHTPCAG